MDQLADTGQLEYVLLMAAAAACRRPARGTDLKTVQETFGHADLEQPPYISLAKIAQRKAVQEQAR